MDLLSIDVTYTQSPSIQLFLERVVCIRIVKDFDMPLRSLAAQELRLDYPGDIKPVQVLYLVLVHPPNVKLEGIRNIAVMIVDYLPLLFCAA